MNNLNVQLFTDISSTEAEVIQGGWDFTGYRLKDGKGDILAQADSEIPNLKYPNRISSVLIKEGLWGIYDEDNSQVLLEVVGPSSKPQNLIYNNRANSIERIG